MNLTKYVFISFYKKKSSLIKQVSVEVIVINGTDTNPLVLTIIDHPIIIFIGH